MYGFLFGMLLLLAGATVYAAAPGGGNSTIPPDPPLADPVYGKQDVGVAKPSALEFWLMSPKRHKDYPWNIIRMWFPEAASISNAEGKEIWRLHMITDPAAWEATPTGLRAECEIPGGGKFIRTVVKDGATTHFTLTFRNQSGAEWKSCNAGSCLQLSAAADYEDNVGDRTYWVLDGELVPTYHLAITDAGMRGTWGVGQKVKLKDGSMRTVSEGAVFVKSKDDKYVLGYSWQPPTGLFYNRAGIVACNHVQPASFDVPAAGTKTAQGIMFVHEGTLKEAYQRYLDWKASPPPVEQPAPPLDASFFENCAFVCVDIQPMERTVATLESMPKAWRDAGMKPEDLNKATDYKFDVAFPNARKVADACRSLGLPMVFIHWGHQFRNGMDLDPDIYAFMKSTHGPDAAKWPNHVSDRGARPAEFLGVREGEYVIAKTDHDAFRSSNLRFVLQNLGVRNIVFIGGHTDACLGKTSIAAKDLGYKTLCVEDATFSGLMSLWRSGLESSRYDYVVKTGEFLELVEAARPKKKAK